MISKGQLLLIVVVDTCDLGEGLKGGQIWRCSFFLFDFLGERNRNISLFPEYFVPSIAVSSLYGECRYVVLHFFPPDGVFLQEQVTLE